MSYPVRHRNRLACFSPALESVFLFWKVIAIGEVGVAFLDLLRVWWWGHFAGKWEQNLKRAQTFWKTLFLADTPATTVWKARHKMVFHGRKLLVDYSLTPEEDSVFFNSEQIRFFFRNDSQLHLDLGELGTWRWWTTWWCGHWKVQDVGWLKELRVLSISETEETFIL